MWKRVSRIALSASPDKGVPLSAIFKHLLPLDGSSTSSMMIGLWFISTTVLQCCLSWPASLLSLLSYFSITLSEMFSLDYALLFFRYSVIQPSLFQSINEFTWQERLPIIPRQRWIQQAQLIQETPNITNLELVWFTWKCFLRFPMGCKCFHSGVSNSNTY
jgi:hypothetical protein